MNTELRSHVARFTARLGAFARTGVASIAIAIAGAAAIVGPAPTASAQFLSGGMNMGMDMSISRRSLDSYAKILDLTDDQKTAARALLEGQRAAAKDLAKEMQTKMEAMMEEARESSDWTQFQKKSMAIQEEMEKKATSQEKAFYEDVKLLLTPEQEAQWPKIERHRRRETIMRFGIVGGMSVDLYKVLDQAKIEPGSVEGLVEILDRYETDLDTRLKDFERIGKEAQKSAVGEGMMDFEAQRKAIKDVEAQGRMIRDINRDYTRRVLAVIPEDKKAEVELLINRRIHPRVYKETYAEKAMAAALSMKSLSDDQRSSLAAYQTTFMRDLANANDKWAKANDEKEEKAGGKISAMMDGFMGGMDGMGGEKDTSVTDARKARKEIEDRALDRLKSVLSEEQYTALPEKKADPRGQMGFIEDMGIMMEEDED
ncbi:MAG: Spy/CpxP family protein refolding chaperone [Phycisphaerales bacterium]